MEGNPASWASRETSWSSKGFILPSSCWKRNSLDNMECGRKQLSPTPLQAGNLAHWGTSGGTGVFIPLPDWNGQARWPGDGVSCPQLMLDLAVCVLWPVACGLVWQGSWAAPLDPLSPWWCPQRRASPGSCEPEPWTEKRRPGGEPEPTRAQPGPVQAPPARIGVSAWKSGRECRGGLGVRHGLLSLSGPW